jgi:hypothetical protein
MYRYTINQTPGEAHTIDQVLAALRAALDAAAAGPGRRSCRWAITSPADRLHTGATTFGRPGGTAHHITETLTTVRENLHREAAAPPVD